MDGQELELLEGFRRLCPSDRNAIIMAVTMAVTAEEAVRCEFEALATGWAKNQRNAAPSAATPQKPKNGGVA